MLKKITFINPPYERIATGYDFLRHITNQSPSLGLLHLAAEVRLRGYQPSIIESDIFNLSVDEVAHRVVEEKPDYVGITLFTVGVWGAAAIARKIKAALPDIVIIVGGPHISSMGPETIQRFPEFDVAVVGEGERPLMDLLSALDNGQSLFRVPSLIYRQGESVLTTAALPINKVLDELPFPAWDLLPDFPTAYKPAIYDYPRGPVATIAASRGCPFHCKFCDTSTFGAKVRAYSPTVVFNMMRHLQDTYGVQHIMFVDDLFLASRVRVTELCNLILESGLKMTWTCTARVDTVKSDLLELMKRAGCWEISFGLETGSDELLRKMDKMARVESSTQGRNVDGASRHPHQGVIYVGLPWGDPGDNRNDQGFHPPDSDADNEPDEIHPLPWIAHIPGSVWHEHSG